MLFLGTSPADVTIPKDFRRPSAGLFLAGGAAGYIAYGESSRQTATRQTVVDLKTVRGSDDTC